MSKRSTPGTGHAAAAGRDRTVATALDRQPLPHTGDGEHSSRGRQHRQAMRRARRPWWRGPAPLVGTVAMVLVVIGVFVVLANQGSARDSAPIGQPAPASTVQQVVAIGPSVLSAVGTGRLANPLRAISGPALTSDGKPQVLYIGGDFCPVCAADRWSLVNALSRFGTFSNLHYSRSAVDDGNLATFTFHDSSYASAYISFVSVEHEDRDRNLLEPLTSEQAQLLSTLGGNAYPFVDIAGQYINRAPNAYVGGYDQTVLSGKDWAQIAGALHNPNDAITQGVVGSANYLTAAICTVTHNRPSSACGTSTIRQIEQQLLQQR